jgi:hypothetical protein
MLEKATNNGCPIASPTASTAMADSSIGHSDSAQPGRATSTRQSRLSVTARQDSHTALPVRAIR